MRDKTAAAIPRASRTGIGKMASAISTRAILAGCGNRAERQAPAEPRRFGHSSSFARHDRQTIGASPPLPRADGQTSLPSPAAAGLQSPRPTDKLTGHERHEVTTVASNPDRKSGGKGTSG